MLISCMLKNKQKTLTAFQSVDYQELQLWLEFS